MANFVRIKSILEITDNLQAMNALLDTARVVHRNIYFPDQDENVSYKDLLDRILEILNRTFEGREELSHTEGQGVRAIGKKVENLSSQIGHSCFEKVIGFCGEVFCCGDYSYCGFVICKEMSIFHLVDLLDG